MSHQDVPYDPLSRFSVIHDLRSQVQEIAHWKAEKSIKFVSVTESGNTVQLLEGRAERFPLLSVILNMLLTTIV